MVLFRTKKVCVYLDYISHLFLSEQEEKPVSIEVRLIDLYVPKDRCSLNEHREILCVNIFTNYSKKKTLNSVYCITCT